MTLAELNELAASPNEGNVIRHTEAAKIIVAHRFIGGRGYRAGSRIDLGCEVCGHRVALSPKSVRFIAEGKHPVCRECFCAATERNSSELPRGE